jgi:hypothetical protein
MQRVEASKRADDGIDWRPRLFRPVEGGPGGPDEGQEDLDFVINAKMYVAPSSFQLLCILTYMPSKRRAHFRRAHQADSEHRSDTSWTTG